MSSACYSLHVIACMLYHWILVNTSRSLWHFKNYTNNSTHTQTQTHTDTHTHESFEMIGPTMLVKP